MTFLTWACAWLKVSLIPCGRRPFSIARHGTMYIYMVKCTSAYLDTPHQPHSTYLQGQKAVKHWDLKEQLQFKQKHLQMQKQTYWWMREFVLMSSHSIFENSHVMWRTRPSVTTRPGKYRTTA
jgi:hypothetical protein